MLGAHPGQLQGAAQRGPRAFRRMAGARPSVAAPSKGAPQRSNWRWAPAWLLMRAQNGQVYSTDTGRRHPFAEDLLRVRGDVDVVAHDLMASLQACADAVMGSIEDGRVPVVIGGDDSLLYACVKGFHHARDGSIGIIHFDAHLDLMNENRQQGRFSQSSGMRRGADVSGALAGGLALAPGVKGVVQRLLGRQLLEVAVAVDLAKPHRHSLQPG